MSEFLQRKKDNKERSVGKRIACICGKPGRVQHTRMKFLRDNYMPYLDVFADEVPDLKKYDVVYFSHYSLAKKVKFDGVRLASVTSHKYDKKELKKFDKISVNNRMLLKELAEFKPALTENGVDTKFWYYRHYRADHCVVGWVGNKDRATKRYSVWQQIRKRMEPYGFPFSEVVTSKHGSQIYDDRGMRSFYHSIGTLVCTSFAEGTPNPALEALSCGCRVVAPPIGNLADIPYVVPVKWSGDASCYEEVISLLADGWVPGYTKYQARKYMENHWDWSIKYKAWDNFFKKDYLDTL